MRSIFILAQNTSLSCRMVADEWSDFAKERECFRFSSPLGIPGSGYFLLILPRYGTPITIVFTISSFNPYN